MEDKTWQTSWNPLQKLMCCKHKYVIFLFTEIFEHVTGGFTIWKEISISEREPGWIPGSYLVSGKKPSKIYTEGIDGWSLRWLSSQRPSFPDGHWLTWSLCSSGIIWSMWLRKEVICILSRGILSAYNSGLHLNFPRGCSNGRLVDYVKMCKPRVLLQPIEQLESL